MLQWITVVLRPFAAGMVEQGIGRLLGLWGEFFQIVLLLLSLFLFLFLSISSVSLLEWRFRLGL
jgi:hypothetical protein